MVDVRVESLTKEFNVPNGTEVAVNSLDLTISAGEFLTLLGPSGCGKTTTLRCIAGLESPTRGRIYFDETDVTELPASDRNLAMMFQDIALYPHMKLRDNIAYPLKVRHVSEEERYEKVESAAESMQIADLLDKHPGEVSGGQRQRAALARTMVQNPVAFLMDEPLSDLDAKLKSEIQEEILRVHKQLKRPTIYVTHDQQEALRLSDTIVLLNDGELVQRGSPREIYDSPKNLFVAEFIGNPSMNFFDVELVSFRDGEATVSTNESQITLSISESQIRPEGDRVILGVRPQTLILVDDGDDADFEGTIELIEPLDERTLATIQSQNDRFRAIVADNENIQEGQQVAFSIGQNAYLFAPEDGRIVAKGSKATQVTRQ